MDSNFIKNFLFYTDLKYQNIIQENKKYNLESFFEIALFNNPDDSIPARITYYTYDDFNNAITTFVGHILTSKNYQKLEFAVVGQDPDGSNETCYIISSIKRSND